MLESFILAQSVTRLFMPYILDFIFSLHKKYSPPLHKSALQTPDVLPRPLMYCASLCSRCGDQGSVTKNISHCIFFPPIFLYSSQNLKPQQIQLDRLDGCRVKINIQKQDKR